VIRTVSSSLELRILKTLTSTHNRSRLAKLSSVLNQACFYSSMGREIYARVMNIARERSLIVPWIELLNDPALSQDTRRYMRRFRRKPVRSTDRLDGLIRQLHNLRRLRAVFFAVDYAYKEFRKDSIDVDRFLTDINEKLSEARSSGESEKWFVHLGQSDLEARNFIRSILSKKIRDNYLPTGIRSFDRRSIGIPRGSFWLLASTTSGGKSVVANQVAGNMAEQGFRVCIVQLEMGKIETGQRHLARVGRIDMGKVIDPRRMTDRLRRRGLRRLFRYHQRIKRRGGLLSIFVPEEDVGIEELLFLLKPMNYDIILIDYIGLMKGADEQDYPRLLGRVARFGKRFAVINNMVVAACAQLSSENILRYSRAMKEHAQNMWMWNYADQKSRDAKIIAIEQPKARNQEDFTFYVGEDFKHMRVVDLDDKTTEAYQRSRQEDQPQSRRRKNNKTSARENTFRKEKSRRLLDDEDFTGPHSQRAP